LTQGFHADRMHERNGRGVWIDDRERISGEKTRRAEMTTGPEKIVRDFCDAWSRKNIDELMSFFDAGAVYHNIPVPAVRGAEAIRAAFLGFADLMDTINIEVLGIASDGNLVFTERVDRFRWQGKALDLPVAGVFEIRDGKIIAHRDYFDYETWKKATGIPLG
jgi:limonene-1,2-epoxide hydrolase